MFRCPLSFGFGDIKKPEDVFSFFFHMNFWPVDIHQWWLLEMPTYVYSDRRRVAV